MCLTDSCSSIELRKLIKHLFSPEILNDLIMNHTGNRTLNMLIPKMNKKVTAEVISMLESNICFEGVKAKVIEFNSKKS